MLEKHKKQLKKNLHFLAHQNPKYLNIFKKYDFVNNPFSINEHNEEIVIEYQGNVFKTSLEDGKKKIDSLNDSLRYVFYDITYNNPLSKKLKEIINKSLQKKEQRSEDFLQKRLGRLMIIGLFPFFHLEELIKYAKEKKINIIDIYESDIGFFFIYLSLVDIEKIFSYGVQINFNLSNNLEDLVSVFEQTTLFALKNGVFTGYIKSYETPTSNIIEREFVYIYEKWLVKTDERFFPVVVENFLDNYSDAIYLSLQKTEPRNITVALVGSGPSLEKDIDFLKKKQKNLFIAALSSSARILILNGIKPDVVFVLDPFLDTENYPIFKDVEQELKDSFLISSVHISPSIKGLFQKRGVVFLNMFQLCFRERLYKKFFSATTVLNMALNFLFEAKVKNIILFGIDFGTKDKNKLHAQGYFQTDEISTKHIEVEGNFGQKVYSPMDYYISKQSVEGMVKVYQRDLDNFFSLYNASDGAKVEGFQPLKIEQDFLDDFLTKEETRRYLESIFTLKQLSLSEEAYTIHNGLQKSIKLMKNIQSSIKTKNLKNFKKNLTKLLLQEKSDLLSKFYLDTFAINLLRQIHFYSKFIDDASLFFQEISKQLGQEIIQEIEKIKKSCEKLEKKCKKN